MSAPAREHRPENVLWGADVLMMVLIFQGRGGRETSAAESAATRSFWFLMLLGEEAELGGTDTHEENTASCGGQYRPLGRRGAKRVFGASDTSVGAHEAGKPAATNTPEGGPTEGREQPGSAGDSAFWR